MEAIWVDMIGQVIYRLPDGREASVRPAAVPLRWDVDVASGPQRQNLTTDEVEALLEAESAGR